MLERFFTDAVSNTVILDDVKGALDQLSVERLLGDGRPLRLLLHEKTHHACFDSDVGAALGAINIMAAQPVDPAWVSPQLSLAQRDFLMARSAYRMLEPLLEGLALFAEHDLLPGDTPAASPVTVAAAGLLFARNGGDPFETLRSVLLHLRRHPQSARDKRLLLTRPLAGRPAYLLGYLAVKILYWRLLTRCPRLGDPDLFVMLMVDYWFHDWELANRLLATNTPIDPDALFAEVGSLARYLSQRSRQLLVNVDGYVDELLAFVASSPAGGTRPMHVAMGPSYHNHGAGPPPILAPLIRIGHLGNHSAASIFDYRPDFRFASTAVTLSVSSGLEATLTTADGKVVGERIPCVPRTTRGTFAGAIEGVITEHGGWRIAIVVSGVDGLVAVQDWGRQLWNPPDLVDYFDEFPSAVEVLDVIRELSVGQARTAAEPKVAVQLARFDEYLTKETVALYFWWATGGGDRVEIPLFALPLADAGVAGPLPDDRLLEILTRLSATLGCQTYGLAEIAASYRWDMATLPADIERINAPLKPVLGKNVIVVHGEGVSSLV